MLLPLQQNLQPSIRVYWLEIQLGELPARLRVYWLEVERGMLAVPKGQLSTARASAASRVPVRGREPAHARPALVSYRRLN